MKSLRRAWSRLKGAVYNHGREAEVADEFEAHIQMLIDDNIRLGMLPEEARRAALLKFGGVEPTKQAYRDQRGLPFLEILVKDLHYAARALRKSPSFTSVAILCLALGIGANTAIFSLINAVVLRPLPVEKPEELEHVGLLIGVPRTSVSRGHSNRQSRRPGPALLRIFTGGPDCSSRARFPNVPRTSPVPKHSSMASPSPVFGAKLPGSLRGGFLARGSVAQNKPWSADYPIVKHRWAAIISICGGHIAAPTTALEH